MKNINEENTGFKIPWGLICILVLIPILLYIGLSSPCGFNAVGGEDAPKVWLGFWATYIGAIASFVMVYYTYKTLLQNQKVIDQNDTTLNQNQELIDITKDSVVQNKELIELNQKLFELNNKQLDELKHQWAEQNRARLQFCIAPIRGVFFLKISNIGNENAYNINLKFNSEFLDMLYSNTHRKSFEDIQNHNFTIEMKGSKYIIIGNIYLKDNQTENDGEQTFNAADIKQWVDNNKNVDIRITGSYCDTYTIDETFRLNDTLLPGAVVMQSNIELSLDQMQKGLTSPNLVRPIPTIQKSLKTLNENMNNIINKLENNDTK